ncbi:hypothetical protein FSB08_01140 [Paraburkholderia sp. JPY432]|nr:hypothetical protein [Paraburkholderia youngii]
MRRRRPRRIAIKSPRRSRRRARPNTRVADVGGGLCVIFLWLISVPPARERVDFAMAESMAGCRARNCARSPSKPVFQCNEANWKATQRATEDASDGGRHRLSKPRMNDDETSCQ